MPFAASGLSPGGRIGQNRPFLRLEAVTLATHHQIRAPQASSGCLLNRPADGCMPCCDDREATDAFDEGGVLGEPLGSAGLPAGQQERADLLAGEVGCRRRVQRTYAGVAGVELRAIAG